MASALMEAADESSMVLENNRIAGLESQILNSQEVIIRLNRELDSALLRITTLENVCSDNQNDLHEKRHRIKKLNDEMNEREEENERLKQDLIKKDEKLQTLDELVIQLQQEINDEEEKQIEFQSEFGDASQILFDRDLRQLILRDLDDDNNDSPQAILDQYQNNQRLKFHDLLKKSLTTVDISTLIDSDDILFESLTHINSLIRLKETLSHDSKELQHIRSLLHLTNENNEELIKDLLNKRQCVEYLHTKIDNDYDFSDFDLIKHVLHIYFNFQEQQNNLKEYLQLDDDDNSDLNYSKILIERSIEANHIELQLNQRIQNQEQTIEQLTTQLNETIEQRKEIDEMISQFSDQSIDHDTNEVSQLDRIRSILQSNIDQRQALPSETVNDISDQNQQSIIDELTEEMNELKEETSHRKDRLKEIANFLQSDLDDEEAQLNLIHSSLQSSAELRLALSNKLSVVDNNEAILHRLDNYQLIMNTLNSPEKDWTNEITDELIAKLESMKNAENTLVDLQKRLDQAIHNEKQLQTDIEQVADEFAPRTNDDEESGITRIRHSLTEFHQKSSENQDKQDVESQTTDNDEFYQQIKELIRIEEDNPEAIINKIRDLSQLPSQTKIDEVFSNNENLVESVAELNKNFQQLNEEHEKLVNKEEIIDKSIERLMKKFGLSSDSSSRTQIDEICAIFDKFCLDYCQLTSTDIEMMNLIEIFKHIQLFLVENNRLKELINQIDFDKSSEYSDYISKLQTYLAKVDTLCQLICDDNVNIDQALVMYGEKTEHDKDAIEKISDFKQQLLTRLSIDNEEEIFDRLNELEQVNADLKEKLQNNDDVSGTVTSLNITVTEQHTKILEHEETIEKLRAQRERMLSKMKEMKTNNEALADQIKQSSSSLDEFHRKEIDYKNQIEEIEQQLRSANNQIQVTLDECQSQQDLQETMKLEIDSIKHEMETQRKLYESRCRQIINEKNQLDKNKKELFEQKQILEDENKRLQTILHTIKDTLENVDDINSIVDTILKLRHDHITLTSKLDHNNEKMHVENEKLLSNIHQQQSTINECMQTKYELEKRLFDNEQQILNFKQQIEENTHQYQRLQNEYHLYKEDTKTSHVAVINIEQSPPPPQPRLLAVQEAAESKNWMAIDIKDEEVPLTTINKHSTIDTPTALFNLLGELKSKLGITLTHRPRSSSAFFVYLCAVHLLTIYLLFIRHC